MVDPFESPKLLVEEAKLDLKVISDLQAAFFATRPMATFARPERGTGKVVYGLRPTAQIPVRIRIKANTVIGHLRNALDQATYTATTEISGQTKKTKTYFPFCQSPKDFEVVMGKGCADIPSQIRPYLLALEPYPTSTDHSGGNDLFRALGKVAGPVKHQMALALSLDTQKTQIGNLSTRGGGFSLLPMWSDDRNEFRVLIADAKCQVSFDVTPWLFIRFNDASAIGSAPFTAVLRDLCGMVESVVLGIEAETIRIKGSAGLSHVI